MNAPTAPPVTGQGSTLHLLMRRFPGIPFWYGAYTGHWWALVGGRLAEAPSLEELGRLLDRKRITPSDRRR